MMAALVVVAVYIPLTARTLRIAGADVYLSHCTAGRGTFCWSGCEDQQPSRFRWAARKSNNILRWKSTRQTTQPADSSWPHESPDWPDQELAPAASYWRTRKVCVLQHWTLAHHLRFSMAGGRSTPVGSSSWLLERTPNTIIAAACCHDCVWALCFFWYFCLQQLVQVAALNNLQIQLHNLQVEGISRTRLQFDTR
jgi:hypothetical protein